jgi:hypothetical protein
MKSGITGNVGMGAGWLCGVALIVKPWHVRVKSEQGAGTGHQAEIVPPAPFDERSNRRFTLCTSGGDRRTPSCVPHLFALS